MYYMSVVVVAIAVSCPASSAAYRPPYMQDILQALYDTILRKAPPHLLRFVEYLIIINATSNSLGLNLGTLLSVPHIYEF